MTIISAPTTTRKRPQLLIAAAAATSLVLVAVLVFQATTAAWTTDTANAGNSWGTATLGLSQTPTSVMFAATNMLPGDSDTATITIANTGTVDLSVALYGANLADADTLAQYLNLVVTVGATDVYTGTVAGFAGTHTNHGNGVGDGTSAVLLQEAGATGDSYSVTFTVTLDSNTPETHQGADATIDFVWEGVTV